MAESIVIIVLMLVVVVLAIVCAAASGKTRDAKSELRTVEDELKACRTGQCLSGRTWRNSYFCEAERQHIWRNSLRSALSNQMLPKATRIKKVLEILDEYK